MTSMMDEMDAAHRRDQQAKNEMRELRQHINRVLESNRRIGPRSRAALIDANTRLWDDMLHVDAVWD